MSRWTRRLGPWLVMGAMALCALPAMQAHAQASGMTVLLDETESLRTIDHPRFLRLLEEARQQTTLMSTRERWRLRYLDAWQASFEGDYVKADPLFQDVIAHSGDALLAAKSSAVLMDDMGNNKRYEEAFDLANRLVAELPSIQDKPTRFMVLSYLSQLLRSAGQYDLAAGYAREMSQSLPPGHTACQPMAMLLTTLYAAHKLSSSSEDLQQGIDACAAAKEPVFADTLWLVKASLHLDEDEPLKAIELLHRIEPGIQANQYYSNLLASKVELAQAYWKLGDDGNASKAALAALASSDAGDISESLRDAYQVLYLIEKKRGNAAAALAYYEQYVTQDIGYLNDVSAKALAYDVAQQHMLAQKLETEKLSRQNNTLRLQQALANKAVETSRLYIALLLLVLLSIVFWLLRLKRSQLRFKKLSRIDGLTGISNHQHFFGDAGRALRQLERKGGVACLVSIDLDHFKQVNDTHGHAMGDSVLRRTVEICKKQLRPLDMFGRVGGEEFGVLLLDCTREQGLAIAGRIRTAIEASPVQGDDGLVSFSASVGIACTDTSGYALPRLCKEADAALYRAKRTGRNRVIADIEGEHSVEA
ncbi:MAG TPA: GGDEF domain-containing protein [Dyella sp.]|uniref:sensor domain-containing diguanylate cyclase n=1 Tax=Dyella sp. TaxID=1869338 RepID=UPI002D76A776|nr:GGDEF domain-containing protein [Dyella sp.]HET6553554.1 GGDEF domain-containing protein [Dyella sp.]